MSDARLDRLRSLTQERDKLVERLDDSLTLQTFYPEAFAHGTCKSSTFGSPSRGYVFKVTRGNGDSREWPIADVPEQLWSRGVPTSDVPMLRKAAATRRGAMEG